VAERWVAGVRDPVLVTRLLESRADNHRSDDMPIFVKGDAPSGQGQQVFPFTGNGDAIWERVGPSTYVHVNGVGDLGSEVAVLTATGQFTPVVVPQKALDGVPAQFKLTRETWLSRALSG
jgi:hypothetical protein